jgi:hypothetical protein
MAPLAHETTKRVTFYEKVTVVHFPSMNRVLRRELFYNRADIEQFQMDVYIESIIRQRSLRRLAEQAQCKGMICQEEDEEAEQNDSIQARRKPVNLVQDRPGTAIAA